MNPQLALKLVPTFDAYFQVDWRTFEPTDSPDNVACAELRAELANGILCTDRPDSGMLEVDEKPAVLR